LAIFMHKATTSRTSKKHPKEAFVTQQSDFEGDQSDFEGDQSRFTMDLKEARTTLERVQKWSKPCRWRRPDIVSSHTSPQLPPPSTFVRHQGTKISHPPPPPPRGGGRRHPQKYREMSCKKFTKIDVIL